jgi:hypothetical protein
MRKQEVAWSFRSCSLVLLLAGGVAAAGCSFSYSSKSSSDSSQSSSKSASGSSQSSSDSSSPGRARARKYKEDVADYTQAFVISGGAAAAFMNGIAAIAEKRGVSDWESDAATWEGIGAGLARAKVKKEQLEVYKQNWSGGNPEAMKGIQRGYDSAR